MANRSAFLAAAARQALPPDLDSVEKAAFFADRVNLLAGRVLQAGDMLLISGLEQRFGTHTALPIELGIVAVPVAGPPGIRH